jgi:hypothetical protein
MSARANRIAIVGPATMLGSDLKDRLAAAGYPGEAVELLDLDDHVGLLTDYGDEARVVLEAADASLRGFELVCFCGDPQTTTRFAPAAAERGTAIDCTGVMSAEPDTGLLGIDGSPHSTGLLVVPHAATLLLVELGTSIDLTSASCTIVLPASEQADAGTEEMAEQASALLNLAEMPDEVFGRRLAFDIWPDATRPAGTASRIRTELEQLGVTAPALRVLHGSTFHGVAASLYVPSATAKEATAMLADVTVQDATNDGDPIDSPARVVGRDGPHVELRDDPAGGCWVWLIADNYRAVTASTLHAIDVRLGRPA